jgi:transposase
VAGWQRKQLHDASLSDNDGLNLFGAIGKKPHIHLIVDNYATHKTVTIRNWLAKRPRYHVHFTPTGGSWLNQVERWFGLLSQRAIKRGAHTSSAQLEKAIRDYIDAHNEEPKPFIWHKPADEILASIARFADRTNKIHLTN